MKFFIAFLFVAVFATGAVSAAIGEPSKQSLQQGLQPSSGVDSLDALRVRKSAYGAAPAPLPSIPCPKNYLFSCQPQLQPVACAQPAYQPQGAYSEFIPQWAPLPQEN